jgi:hypothetical protein
MEFDPFLGKLIVQNINFFVFCGNFFCCDVKSYLGGILAFLFITHLLQELGLL